MLRRKMFSLKASTIDTDLNKRQLHRVDLFESKKWELRSTISLVFNVQLVVLHCL